MITISRAHAAAASAALALLVACGTPSGPPAGGAPAPDADPAYPPMPLARVFVLEAAGSQPEDTVATVPRGAGRVIVLRRGAPDFGLFAVLEFPPGSDTTRPSDSARVNLRPAPGLYTLSVDIAGPVADSAVLTFSYGAHFVAPAGARQRYGSDLTFERQLAVGRLGSDGMVTFLPTSRPGSDMVRTRLSGPGRYLVAAPR